MLTLDIWVGNNAGLTNFLDFADREQLPFQRLRPVSSCHTSPRLLSAFATALGLIESETQGYAVSGLGVASQWSFAKRSF
jgi:hypothetical protein